MDNPTEKKFGFKDDVIDLANKKALDVGKNNFKNEKEIFAQIQNGANQAQTSQPQPETKIPQSKIKNLRTFQGDVAEAIKNQNESILSITMAEESRKGRSQAPIEQTMDPEKDSQASILERIVGRKPERKFVTPTIPQPKPIAAQTPVVEVKPIPQAQPVPQSIYRGNNLIRSSPKKTLSPEVYKNGITVIVSVLLIVLGIGAIGGFYYLQKKTPTIEAPTPIDQTMIPFDKKEVLDSKTLSTDILTEKLEEFRRETSLQQGNILYIGLSYSDEKETRSLRTDELFKLLDTSAPGSLLRAFGSEFMLGMYRTESNQPFLLIKLSSFDNAFDGMFKWEKTLNKDLGSIFSARSIPITSFVPVSNSTSTQSSSTIKTTPVTRIINTDIRENSYFEDITIRNKDARVLKNARGETILLYSFLDQKTVLITSSEDVLREIINKLIAGKLVR